jgi:hypothetical protein
MLFKSHCIQPFLRVDITDQESIKDAKDSTIKERGKSGSKRRPENSFEPKSGMFHSGQFSRRFLELLSFCFLTMKSKTLQ